MACRPRPVRAVPAERGHVARYEPRDELIGGLDRGLLVTRFHYTNVVHPKLAMITGMTRDGTFLVEGGKIVGPVRNLRFTQSSLEALAGVSAVSAPARRFAASSAPRLFPRSYRRLDLHRRHRVLISG